MSVSAVYGNKLKRGLVARGYGRGQLKNTSLVMGNRGGYFVDTWWQVVLTAVVSIICATLGSSGFWSYKMSRNKTQSAQIRLMMGLAYIELMTLGSNYIQRGSITRDEYEDYRKYFYDPYKELGGNGVAERIMGAVESLPIAPSRRYAEVAEIRTREGEHINNARVVARQD
jgi:hypothetical protein